MRCVYAKSPAPKPINQTQANQKLTKPFKGNHGHRHPLPMTPLDASQAEADANYMPLSTIGENKQAPEKGGMGLKGWCYEPSRTRARLRVRDPRRMEVMTKLVGCNHSVLVVCVCVVEANVRRAVRLGCVPHAQGATATVCESRKVKATACLLEQADTTSPFDFFRAPTFCRFV